MWLRALAIWVVMMAAESARGVLCGLLLAPRVGEFRARQISFFTGMVLLAAIVYALIPWMNARMLRRLVTVRLLWVVLTLAFEIALGRLVFRFAWDRVLAEYLPWRGGLMAFGMLVLAALPTVARLRQVEPFDRR